MATTTPPPRRLTNPLITAVIAAALAAAGVLGSPPTSAAAATELIVPTNATLTITTAGWGHGRGMSQYGANAAAKQGVAWQRILAFYYPGTTMTTLPKGDKLRVWITADTDNRLHFYPAAGLRVRDSAGKVFNLPTGKNYTKWRVSRSGNSRVLYYRDAKGKYHKYTSSKFKLNPKRSWYVENTKSHKVRLYLASGNRTYRGALGLAFVGTGARTINYVSTENYLRSVVPSEMPASWNADALRAQAVAARSYAARYRANLAHKQVYDICNTTSCQVYKGTMSENSATDAAVKATAAKVLTSGGQYAWTEFSSSNGGYAAAGSHPYLTAHQDPYDAAANQVYSTTVKVSTLQAKYPTIGTLKSVSLQRDGKGRWGGRVTKVTLTGSKGTKTVSGTSFKSTLGLRETMMTISGGLAKNTANYVRWQQYFGGTKGRLLGVPAGTEQLRAGGLYAPFEKGALWWSTATGSKRLSVAAAALYLQAGGPEKSGLGFPTGDEVAFTEDLGDGFAAATRVDFQVGIIRCKAGATKAADCTLTKG